MRYKWVRHVHCRIWKRALDRQISEGAKSLAYGISNDTLVTDKFATDNPSGARRYPIASHETASCSVIRFSFVNELNCS